MPMSMSYVSKENLALVMGWERLGCVERAKPEKASIHQFDIYCADPRRPHMFRWLSENFHAKENCCDHSADPMIVQVPYFGAAMTLGLGNPISPDDYIWNDFLARFTFTQDEIAQGKINQINIVHHWPCRMGELKDISLEDSIPLVLMGKARIKHARLVPHVAPLLWLDIGPNESLVWRMKLQAFIEYFKIERPRYYQMLENHLKRLNEEFGQQMLTMAAD